MNIEMVFRIYHKMCKRNLADFCEKIVITRDRSMDLETQPTSIKVKFVSNVKRELTEKERAELKPLCDTYNLGYYLNEKGEMIWYQGKRIVPGNKKTGKM